VIPIEHAESEALRNSMNSQSGEQQLTEGLTSLEQRYLLSVSRFLFTMEYVLVLNYVEAIIPLIFGEQLRTIPLGSRVP